jgi:hypothetical protein
MENNMDEEWLSPLAATSEDALCSQVEFVLDWVYCFVLFSLVVSLRDSYRYCPCVCLNLLLTNLPIQGYDGAGLNQKSCVCFSLKLCA